VLVSLGGINVAKRKWRESDLKIGCRLLPGRDDDILEYFSEVGRNEKSYKIREALRMYTKVQMGLMPMPGAPLIRERWLPPVSDPNKMISVANNIVAAKNTPMITANEGEELTPEQVEANLFGLLNSFE